MIKLFERILKLSGRYRKQICVASVFAVLKAVCSKMPLWLAFVALSKFYDGMMRAEDCVYMGITLVLTVLLESLCQFISDRLQSGAGYLMFADKRLELGNHLRRMPMGYFTAGNIGKISSVLSTDMIFAEEIAMSTLANMMSYGFSTCLMLLFVIFLDVRLGAIAVGITVFVIAVAGRMNRVSLKEAVKRQEQSEKLVDAVLAYAEGISVIKSYNLLGEKSAQLTGNFEVSKNTSLRFEESMVPWNIALNVLYAVGMAALFGVSILLCRAGELPVPYVLGLLLFVFELFGPLKALYGEAARLTVMNSCLDRVEALCREEELPDTGKSPVPERNEKKPEIAFEHVSFSYENDQMAGDAGTDSEKTVLKDVSFQLYPNTMTALAGPSGGGKSTIANLVARFWDIDSGRVTIRGNDIRQVPLSELMDQISMVFQRVYLFQDTVYNNISMGRPEASREEVYEAAKKARCYDFIMNLPEGFDTIVGEGGATLSGGEKQRISIARCILKDTPIVVLDEATASVDLDNERYIQEAISELVKGKTLLVIAHRLNTIKAADQILVVADGHIVQRGTHETLVKEEGIYRDYVAIRERTA